MKLSELRGVPLWKRGNPLWHYWIDGKQGYRSGMVYAASKRAATRAIREDHPGCVVNAVLSDKKYHS